MEIERQLNNVLLHQDFNQDLHDQSLDRLMVVAQNYAIVENAISVLSDMQKNASVIFYGGFAKMLGVTVKKAGQGISSIWEKEILDCIHPDDLYEKYVLELRFFQFMKHTPIKDRGNYYLAERLRMKDPSGNYLQVLHRMFYFNQESGHGFRYALCLYTPIVSEFPLGGRAINSVTSAFL